MSRRSVSHLMMTNELTESGSEVAVVAASGLKRFTRLEF